MYSGIVYGYIRGIHQNVLVSEGYSTSMEFKSYDLIFDPDFEGVHVLLYNPAKDISDHVWLPRQYKLQKICIHFYVRSIGFSRQEAFFHFLE
jgi:hypothetical protein